MVKNAHVVEKTGPDPAQVVFVLFCEQNAGTYSSVNKTEAAHFHERMRVFEQVHMMWEDAADIAGDVSKSGTERLEYALTVATPPQSIQLTASS